LPATPEHSRAGGFLGAFDLAGQHPAEASTDLEEAVVMLNQRRSPPQLSRTRGRHVPRRAKDDRDWKKSTQ